MNTDDTDGKRLSAQSRKIARLKPPKPSEYGSDHRRGPKRVEEAQEDFGAVAAGVDANVVAGEPEALLGKGGGVKQVLGFGEGGEGVPAGVDDQDWARAELLDQGGGREG